MRLAFYKGTGHDPVDLAICARTNGIYCHVELLFSDGSTFSSTAATGTRFTKPGSIDFSEHWTIVDLGPTDEAKVREWCEKAAGVHYGFIGIACFLADLPDWDGKHPFCSQVCVEALQQTIGVFGFVEHAYAISPQTLYYMAESRLEGLATGHKA